MTNRQKLILFLISCDPGIRDIHRMVRIYDAADFPSKMKDHLGPLLENKYIVISEYHENGSALTYTITKRGIEFLESEFDEHELIEHVGKMQQPEFLLELTQAYLGKRNTESK